MDVTWRKRTVLLKYLMAVSALVGGAALSGIAVAQSTVKAVALFDGKTLTGWKTVDPTHMKLWSVADSMITSGDGLHKIPENTYLHTLKAYGDFEFRCLFRLHGDPSTGMINSGIQYRSVLEGGKIVGYQADIGEGYWGDLYDEHRRGKLVGGDVRTLTHLLKPDGWNSYIIRCTGNRHELYINGVKTCDYREQDSTIPQKGVIAVQIHSGGAARVEFRDLVISER
ncbi:3-keto-disaccharide hydrolase [Fibrella arboris]|uniref:3-keto-disaccharide hydrolase n=1 Tax=Fibrella arboris TaxID=3242486 RepID=UPI003520B53E